MELCNAVQCAALMLLHCRTCRIQVKTVVKRNTFHGKSFTENRYSYLYDKGKGAKLQIFRQGVS